MGLFDEPVQPRPIPQVEQMNRHSDRYDEQRPERKRHAISHAKPRSMWPLFAFLGCGFMLFMFLIVVGVGLWVWSVYGTDDSGESNQAIVTSNPAEYAIHNYAGGLSDLYGECERRAIAGEWESLEQSNGFIKPHKEKVFDESFERARLLLETITVDEKGVNHWTNEKAAKVFRTLKEGFAR